MGDSDRIKLGESDDYVSWRYGINFIHSTTSNVDIRFINDGGSTKDAIIIDSRHIFVKSPNDGQTLSLGAGNDLIFQHDGSNSYIGNGVGDYI